MDALQNSLLRAQEAIARARNLSNSLGRATLAGTADLSPPQPLEPQMEQERAQAAATSTSSTSSSIWEDFLLRRQLRQAEAQAQAGGAAGVGQGEGEGAAVGGTTTSISSVLGSSLQRHGSDGRDGDALAAGPQGQGGTPTLAEAPDASSGAADAEAISAGPSAEEQLPPPSALTAVQPMLLVAQKLCLLQRQQSNTMQQLMLLRIEQLTLRQQQLTALSELLRAEVQAVEGTPQQVGAVDQALSLLNQSLEESEDAALMVLGCKDNELQQQVATAVSRADHRAEEVSRMARQLLSVLREYPRRAPSLPPRPTVPGASEAQLSLLPLTRLPPGSPLLGDTCSICLDPFEEGQDLKCLQCVHYCHEECLDRWLRIKAVCPLCKVLM